MMFYIKKCNIFLILWEDRLKIYCVGLYIPCKDELESLLSSQKTKHKVMKKMAQKMNGKIKNMAGRFIIDVQWRQVRKMKVEKQKNRERVKKKRAQFRMMRKIPGECELGSVLGKRNT